MNIKSLLLGSAAALVAVTGARAADVIVPVEEPVEYVRVCDVYGSGFYYIPGTETCLKIGGYVRFKYIVNGAIRDDNDIDYLTNREGDDYRSFSRVRVRLNVDAREETELGTLRAYARVQAENNAYNAPNTDAAYAMDMGYIQLGGLTMGYLDTLWTEGDGLLTDTDLPVGDFQVNRVSYTYAANGFTAALSLEDDGTGDFAPDVVGRIAYEGGWGSVYLAGSYDERVDAFTFASRTGFGVDGDGDGAFALKGALSLKDLVATDSELKFEGSYAFDPSLYSSIGIFDNGTYPTRISTAADNIAVEWQAGAGYAQSFGKMAVAFSGVYGETFDFREFDTVNARFFDAGKADYYKLVANVGYEITNNFDVLAEISYADFDFDGGDGRFDNSLDQTSGFVQFVRSF